MDLILEGLHSFLAFAFLLSALLSFGFAIDKFIRKGHYSSTQLSLARIAFIACHIQLLVGLFIWYNKGFLAALSNDAKTIMADPAQRLLAVEHPLTNIIAIILISIGYISIKKSSTDQSKNLKNIIFYGLGILLILSRIPWNSWIN